MGIITAFITEKCLLDYDTCLIERSRRTSNPAGRSSRISNSAGRLLCVTWFELFSQLATPGRSYARKIRNHSCGGPVEWKNEHTREYLRSERPSRIRPIYSVVTAADTNTLSEAYCYRYCYRSTNVKSTTNSYRQELFECKFANHLVIIIIMVVDVHTLVAQENCGQNGVVFHPKYTDEYISQSRIQCIQPSLR